MKESFTKINHKIKFKKAILKFKKGKKTPIKKICCQAQLGSIQQRTKMDTPRKYKEHEQQNI